MAIVAIAFLGLGFLVVFLGAMSLRHTWWQNPHGRKQTEDLYVTDNRSRRSHVRVILFGGVLFAIGVLLIVLAIP